MKKGIIKSIQAIEVIVPSRPDSLNSESVLDTNAAFARKFHTGERWTDFANQPKWIIKMELENGLWGIGETYRSASGDILRKTINDFIGQDVLALNWRRLPVTDQRIYEAFETAVLDVVGKLLHVPVFQLL